MSVTINDVALRKWEHNGIKVKKWIHNDIKVWSSGAEVSFYDGTTLLAKVDVDEGADVFSAYTPPSKTNYTHTGFKVGDTYYYSGSLIVTDDMETLNVEVIYLPNSLNVYSSSITSWYTVSENYRNSEYISGTPYAYGARSAVYAGAGWAEGSNTFAISLGRYQNAYVSTRWENNNGNSPGATFDGSWISTYASFNITSSGSHTLYCHSYAESGSLADIAICCTGITVSNPKPWV